MACQNIQSALVCDRNSDEIPETQKNCASAGVQLFQVFSSTSALLGLSRSCDYAATNANLNALINWRRTNGLTGQSNMWGEIRGTGLAGGGTGAAGGHGGAASEAVAVQPVDASRREKEQAQQAAGEFPPEYYQREPASADLVVAHREASNPVDVAYKATFSNFENEGFMPMRGLQVSLKSREKNDKVLVIANLPASMPEHHDGATWTLKRGNFALGPQFSSWTHELGRLDNMLMPWVDDLEKARMDVDYSVHCRLKGRIQVSQAQERRQLTAVLVPGAQVTTARSTESLAVQSGKWYDVPGLQQISVTSPGEKVLVVCTIRYTALWSDELTRGRFTIFRDGVPLDDDSYGLQSVRSLQKGLKRTLVMSLVDEPQAGPHVYAVRAAVTTEEGQQRVCQLDEDDRQLALIRLPGSIVVGPNKCKGPTVVEEDKWTEVAGLNVTATVRNASDKVLVVYNTNFNPSGLNYETYFTLFRSSATGGMKNLGQEDQGMQSVASSAMGSSEYPMGMFTDAPGVGTHTYTVHARTRRCDHLAEAPAVEVGPDGQIAMVFLSGRPGSEGASLMQRMGQEMAAAAGAAVAGDVDAAN